MSEEPPVSPHREITDTIYTAAHKALCTLAFALQEVTEKQQNEKENSDATQEQCQTQEETAQRRQHLCHNGKPARSLSNDRTAQVSHQRTHSTLRATIIIIPVPK